MLLYDGWKQDDGGTPKIKNLCGTETTEERCPVKYRELSGRRTESIKLDDSMAESMKLSGRRTES